MFVLTEPISSGWPARRPSPKHGAERLHLDRIAQRRAGAVRLDVVDVGGPHAGVGQRLRGSRASCAGPFGAVSPLLRPSWLTADAADHGQDAVAVPPCASDSRFSTTTPQPSPRT